MASPTSSPGRHHKQAQITQMQHSLYSSDQRPETTPMEQKSQNQKSWLLMETLEASIPALSASQGC